MTTPHEDKGTEITSSVLLHCWRHDDRASARAILKSICRRGLLLTTNSETLDRFEIDRGQGVVALEVMQHARVCFTDIPFDRLTNHGQRYGKYGVSFKRDTIIHWGGLPVWYVPNYWGDNTLKVAGPALVNSLHAGMDAADHFRAFTQANLEIGVPVSVKYEHGPTLTGERLVKELERIKHAIFTVLSFVKEMSPREREDQSYLVEREWRIVYGMNLAGLPPTCRELTADEKRVLCSHRPEWSKPRESIDVNISSRYPRGPVIDSFRYFNGLPNGKTVAQSIDGIVVPDETEAIWASEFITKNRAVLGNVLPRVIIFPSTEG